MTKGKRTPIYEMYKNDAKLMNFGGWELPVQFDGIKIEHQTTRNSAGLFDICHMGDILITGQNSDAFLQSMLTNDVSKLKPNKAQYTLMCYPNGGTIDDFIVYQLDDRAYLLVVNAANIQTNIEWLQQHQIDGVVIEDCSEKIAQLALQGPASQIILQQLTEVDISNTPVFSFQNQVALQGIDESVMIARTGYTGEDGFEIYISATHAQSLWQKLLEVGQQYSLRPIGLGARDTLRLEAGLPLYGNELSSNITPIEASLSFAVKISKQENFIGKQVLEQQMQQGVNRQLVGIEMVDKGIPRHGYLVFEQSKAIGYVTSGTHAPTLAKNLGMVLIDKDYAREGTIIFIEIRKKKLRAKVVNTPFYQRTK